MWVAKYTREVVREGKRVRWPGGKEFWGTLAVVVVISVISALLLSLEDNASYTLLGELEKAFESMR